MRLTILALTLMPFAATAQQASDAQPTQSCPVGMVWDGTAGNCTLASNESSPLGGGGHTGCHGDATREVTS